MLDVFGPEVEFNIGGVRKYRSYTGVGFTLVYAIIMMVAVISELSVFFNRKNPVAVRESFVQDVYPKIDLPSYKLMPILMAFSNEVDMISSKDIGRFFSFQTVRTVWKTESVNG